MVLASSFAAVSFLLENGRIGQSALIFLRFTRRRWPINKIRSMRTVTAPEIATVYSVLHVSVCVIGPFMVTENCVTPGVDAL